MKYRLFILIVFFFRPSPSFAGVAQATLFIDSADTYQSALVEEINQMLFYSPTLRAAIEIRIFDINPGSRAFNGEVIYQHDKEGKAVSQYRPGQLPYLFCLANGKTQTHFTLRNKDQIWSCIKNG